MTSVAIIFGMRVALFMLAAAVAYGFLRRAIAWANADCSEVDNGERLAAGVCMLGIGSIFSGAAQMVTLLAGPDFLEMYLSAMMISIIGIGILQFGYFLCFTAWLSERRAIPVRRVAVLSFLAITAVSGAGVGAFYALI